MSIMEAPVESMDSPALSAEEQSPSLSSRGGSAGAVNHNNFNGCDGDSVKDEATDAVVMITNDDHGDVERLRREVDALRHELATCHHTIENMQGKEQLLRERLSSQAQRQLEKGGSAKFEDLSLGDNRPSQLIRRYGNLYSESRLDALDALDDLPEMAECDDLKAKLLLSVVVLAFRSCQQSVDELRCKTRELLYMDAVERSGSVTIRHSAQELQDTINIYLRRTLDKYDTTKNVQEVCERVYSTLYDYPSLRQCDGLQHYVQDCVSLAWALSVQSPPLVIDYESAVFNPDTHVRFHSSDPDGVEVRCVLWPMLTEGDGGTCVYRGVVIT